MQAYAITSTAMLVTCLVLSIAMALGWACFGRPRHALTWSLAYLLYAVEVLVSVVYATVPAWRLPAEALALACILAGAVLIVTGMRQRVGLPSGWRLSAALAGIVFLAAEWGVMAGLPNDILSAAGSFFPAGTLAFTYKALRPAGRRAVPAERMTMITVALFIAYELALGIGAMACVIDPANRAYQAASATLYLTGLVPLFVANGIAGILLLGSDLAERLHALASHDPLTGLLNRRGFQEAAIRALSLGGRHGQPITVVLADIDHFKSVNDRFGHGAGDQTLEAVGQRLNAGFRHGDLIGRVGGEEFAVLLVDSSAAQAAEALERLRPRIADAARDGNLPQAVTVSFGVAAVRFSGEDTEAVLMEAFDRADRALYQSKLNGRDRITLAEAA